MFWCDLQLLSWILKIFSFWFYYLDRGILSKFGDILSLFWLLFFKIKRTILLLIHHQFLQFWYKCIKKTSICRIIGNFLPNCRRNTRKKDKVYNFLQSTKLTCVDNLRTQTLENPSCSAVQRYTKWRQRIMSNGDCAQWLANRTLCLGSK